MQTSGVETSLFGSFLAWIGTLFRPSSPQARVVVPPGPDSFNPDPDYHPSLEDVPRYPPFDRGLPAIPIERVLETQRELVDRIHASSLPFVQEAVRNLANYVHLLPATSNDVFSGAGGLFRLCLEAGFHSYIASQGNIFTSRDPAEKRRELEPKWQLAAFLAGLCCELGRAINTSVVTNDRGEQWLPFEPLMQWLARTESRRYFLRPPQAQASQQTDPAHLSGIIINSIIPAAAMQHITTEDRSILMEMLGAISRISDTFHSGHFARTVRHVRDLVIARDQKSNPRTFGTPLVGVHVEPYLINAMRHLVKQGTWKRNEKLARVHLAQDGCFLFWSTGVPEILALLRDQGAVGIPSDPRTLGELLVQSDVFQPNGDSGLWWYIRPPGASTDYEVVKLTNPGIILEEEVIAQTSIYPQPIVVASPVQQAQASAPASKLGSGLASSPGLGAAAGSQDQDPSQASATLGDEISDVRVEGRDRAHGPGERPAGFARALEVAAGGGSTANETGDQAGKPKGVTRSAERSVGPIELPAEQTGKPKARSKREGSAKAAAEKDHVDTEAAPEDSKPAPRQESCGDRLGKLRPTNLSTLQSLVQWHNDAESSRKCLWTAQGLAIPTRLIQEAGGDRQSIVVDLKSAKALVFADGQSASSPTSVVHRIDGGIYNMLTAEAAAHLGFEGGESLQ